MANENDIQETLKNVRQAYRYLHEFQLRLRDTIEEFRREFTEYTYCFSGPIYSDIPTFRKNPHDDKWAIDLFPAHTYAMRYENQNVGSKSTLLELLFHCDTNFEAENDSFPIEDEGSESVLEVYFWITNEPIRENVKWQELYNNNTSDYPENGKMRTYEEPPVSALCIKLDFQNLLDKPSIVQEAKRVKGEITKHLNYSFEN